MNYQRDGINRINVLPGYYGNNRAQVLNENTNNPTNQRQTDRKKEALKDIDNTKFGCFYVRAIFVSGISFFTVQF